LRIRLAVTTTASPAVTWAALADIASHVDWMRDADEITFVTEQRAGVGTAFDCRTRVGPFRLLDRMVVTRWDEGKAIGVRHDGLVHGEGVFELRPSGNGSEILWTERLAFPARLGGAITTWLARPVLRAIWKGNLRRLAGTLTGGHH
jgi:hypothetical protein